MPLSTKQQQVLAIIPHITATLSMVGSCCILKNVLTEIRQKTAGTYHRLLLGLSFFDLLTSFFASLATWPIPKGTPGVWGALGTTATCTFQGFMTHLIIACPIYNACLAVYYLLTCRYKWTEAQLQKIEPLMHGIALTHAFGTAIAGLFLNLYNSAFLWCWIAPYPSGCKESYAYGADGNCVRGDNAHLYRWGFTYGPVWVCIITAMGSLVLVYATVLQQERDVDKHQEDGTVRRTRSKRIAWHSFFYMVAFFISWLPGSMLRLLQAIPNSGAKVMFALLVVYVVTIPLQGFLNFLVFYRSKYLKYKREHPNASQLQTIKKAAFYNPKEDISDNPSTLNSGLDKEFSNLARDEKTEH